MSYEPARAVLTALLSRADRLVVRQRVATVLRGHLPPSQSHLPSRRSRMSPSQVKSTSEGRLTACTWGGIAKEPGSTASEKDGDLGWLRRLGWTTLSYVSYCACGVRNDMEAWHRCGSRGPLHPIFNICQTMSLWMRTLSSFLHLFYTCIQKKISHSSKLSENDVKMTLVRFGRFWCRKTRFPIISIT